MADSNITETPLVLVVDDDPMIRMLVTETLKQIGFVVEEVDNGKQALDFMGRCQPDVVLLDVLMPDIPGGSVGLTLQEDPDTKYIPIIFLSCTFSDRGTHEKGVSSIGRGKT